MRFPLLFKFGFVIMCVALSSGLGAQVINNRREVADLRDGTTLIDHFGRINSEERSAKFDLLFHQMQNNATSHGYVILYCGKRCQYGEIEAHIRGIEVKIALRKFDRSRMTVIHGGFRDGFETELWMVKEGGSPPKPEPTVNIKYVTFSGTTRQALESYDCCDDYGEFWKNLKP